MIYQAFWRRLADIYETGEAKAVARYVFETCFNFTLADLLAGKAETLTSADQEQLEQLCRRLEQGEPVQYVTGMAEFGPRCFHVEPGVLIPRPETYELCQWVVEDSLPLGGWGGASILDIGTGSGCIAVTLALDMPNANVTAWDISQKTLHVATDNASKMDARVRFVLQDALNAPPDKAQWDIIVSNPPYIMDKERRQMDANVIGHEPHEALFVPDDDPLLFYRAIARYARGSLKPRGRLYFEINPLCQRELVEMLCEEGFSNTTTRTDQFGKNRFVRVSSCN